MFNKKIKMKLLPVNSVSGKLHIPCSKSEAQRALIIAALSRKPIKIMMEEPSEDVLSLINALKSIDFEITIDNFGITINSFPPRRTTIQLNVNESGFAFRSLAFVALHWADTVILSGEKSLLKRDFSELKEHLKILGIKVESLEDNKILVSGKLSPGKYFLNGNQSSQSISGIFMALSFLEQQSEIIIENVVSFPYLSLTIDMLSKIGCDINCFGKSYHIQKKRSFSDTVFHVQGDWSSAVVWFAAAVLKGELTIYGLSIDSEQPDKIILDVLQRSGVEFSIDEQGISIKKCSQAIRPFQLDLINCPDLFPVLAVFSCGIIGESTFYSIDRLKNKESNRLESIVEMLDVFGVSYKLNKNEISILGTGQINGGIVKTYGDHRLIMAATLATCIANTSIEFEGEQAIHKSYPSFFEHWNNFTF